MSYEQAFDGTPFKPKMTRWMMRCCDCRLVHRVRLRVKKRDVEMTVWRDERRTAQGRRHMKKRTFGGRR